MFPSSFEYELRDALAAALSSPSIMGRQVVGMAEPGEIYEFMFQHEERLVYAKVCLQQPDLVVIVYSAHRPLKGDKL